MKYFCDEQAGFYTDDMIIWNNFCSYYQRKVCLLRYPKFKDEVREVKGINSTRDKLEILADADIKLAVTETEVVW